MEHDIFKSIAAREGWTFIPSHDMWENEDGIAVDEMELKHILFGDDN